MDPLMKQLTAAGFDVEWHIIIIGGEVTDINRYSSLVKSMFVVDVIRHSFRVSGECNGGIISCAQLFRREESCSRCISQAYEKQCQWWGALKQTEFIFWLTVCYSSTESGLLAASTGKARVWTWRRNWKSDQVWLAQGTPSTKIEMKWFFLAI